MTDNALEQEYDSIIIGGGPAGLSAAVYTAREGMKTLVLDQAAFGGMAVTTDIIDNYPGFSKGVSGRELIDEMKAQAERFGAVLGPFYDVSGLETTDNGVAVRVGEQLVRAKTALIATGSTYRKLGVPGEEELIGRGVHFCATCDAPLYKGKRVVAIGGGNSALQEVPFIARFASSVDLLVRDKTFTGTDFLQKAIAEQPNVTVHYDAAVNSMERPEPRGPITVRAAVNGKDMQLETDGVFVFVGLLPNVHGLDKVAKDDRNFVLSDNFQTQLPGVFVAGDVRSGSTWQIGSAVGEGISAALEMRHYLDKHFPGWHKK